MSTARDREPLANLLDYEPELFMGATGSEVGGIVLLSTLLWLGLLTLVFLSIAVWVDVLSIAFAAIPCTVIATFCSSVFALKRLQKAKMNRPDGYFQIVMKLKWQGIATRLGRKPHFETYVGTWGLDRNDL